MTWKRQQLARATEALRAATTYMLGEFIVPTDGPNANRPFLGDGSTVGGRALAFKSDVAAASTTLFDFNAVGADTAIASAPTTDLSTVSTVRALITGTTGITSFGNGQNEFRMVRFAAAGLVITPGANLIVPTGQAITTQVGDTAILSSDGSTPPIWRIRHYERADGTALAYNFGTAAGTVAQGNDSRLGKTLQRQLITASGNFAAPAGTLPTTVFKVTCVGGGGGGAAGASNNVTGGGGGGGGIAIKWYTGLAAAATYACTVGAAGAVAGAGGATSFAGPGGATITANGGAGGGVQGGAGGTSSGGDLGWTGSAGGNGTNGLTSWQPGGLGAASPFGGGGLGGVAAAGSVSNGTAGTGYGAGGGGGNATPSSAGAGAGGAPGLILIEWLL